MRRSVPPTRNSPPANSTSASATSSRCAAIFFPFEVIFSHAKYRAEPPTAIEREPNVPVPAATDADAAQLFLHARLFLSSFESSVFRNFERALENPGKVSAVVGRTHGRLV